MSIFDAIFSVFDPFNVTGFNEEENKKTNENNQNQSNFQASIPNFKEMGIYPWDDDDE